MISYRRLWAGLATLCLLLVPCSEAAATHKAQHKPPDQAAPAPEPAPDPVPEPQPEPLPQPSGAQRPFPQRSPLATDAIKPNHRTQTQLDQSVRDFYAVWRNTYLKAGCGTGRYYVWIGSQNVWADGQRVITVSEGMGYGMTIVTYMAGEDPNARSYFDGLFRFVRDHPSSQNGAVPAWRQLESCRSSSDANTASGGDLWIAFALLLADRQWGSGGGIDYRGEALRTIQAIRAVEMHPTTNLVQLGSWVHASYPNEHDAIRTSDLMPALFRVFKGATGDSAWDRAVESAYQLIGRIQTSLSPHTGLVPGFVLKTNTSTPEPATGFLGAWDSHLYEYNACRFPWNIGLDYVLNGEPRAKAAMDRLQSWQKAVANGVPWQAYVNYDMNGKTQSFYSHRAFIAPHGIGSMVGASHQSWLNALWDHSAVTRIEASQVSDYYGNTINLIGLLAMSGNMWQP